MATTEWFNPEKTIIIHRFDGNWTVQDYYQSIKESGELLSNVDYTVTHFLDMRKSNGLPGGFFSALRGSSKKWHPNSGCVVMIGANRLILAFSRLFNNIYPNPDAKFFIVGSIEEALGVIGEKLSQSS